MRKINKITPIISGLQALVLGTQLTVAGCYDEQYKQDVWSPDGGDTAGDTDVDTETDSMTDSEIDTDTEDTDVDGGTPLTYSQIPLNQIHNELCNADLKDLVMADYSDDYAGMYENLLTAMCLPSCGADPSNITYLASGELSDLFDDTEDIVLVAGTWDDNSMIRQMFTSQGDYDAQMESDGVKVEFRNYDLPSGSKKVLMMTGNVLAQVQQAVGEVYDLIASGK